MGVPFICRLPARVCWPWPADPSPTALPPPPNNRRRLPGAERAAFDVPRLGVAAPAAELQQEHGGHPAGPARGQERQVWAGVGMEVHKGAGKQLETTNAFLLHLQWR